MLQDNVQRPGFVDEGSGSDIDIDKLLGAFRRQWKVVVTAAGVGLVLGVVYSLTATPQYTAVTSLLIDPNNRQLVDQMYSENGIAADEPYVLSQVEILSSQKVALSVVDKLDLLNDPSFRAGKKSPLAMVIGAVKSVFSFRDWFKSGDVDSDREIARQSAADSLLNGLDAARVGRTYVLSISFTSPSSELSAKIANSVAEAYLTEQLESKFDATRRASDWLQTRIAELKQKSIDSDLAVQRFKSQNDLISTNGQLISDQQLSQLNAQLIIAQSESANAKAKYDRIQNIINTGEVDASVTEALNSAVISELQGKYLDASRREADIANRLGDGHMQAIRLRNEMQEYKRLMFVELSRIADASNSTYKVARAREQDLSEQVKAATGVSALANDAQVQLRQLEREADTYKALYGTFLQRFQEATQQQSFPITEARIISKARPPQIPSKPKKVLVIALFLVGGLGAGAALGGYREYRDRFFRTGDQVRQTLDVEYLGQVPIEADAPYETGMGNGENTAANPRLTRITRRIFNYAVDHPLSSFAETLRSVKIASDIVSETGQGQVIGVISALPGEGKSTIAVNLAQLLAHQGARVILVDGDLRAAGTTKALAAHAESGVLEVLTAGVPLTEALVMDSRTRLAVLPAVKGRRTPYSSELLSSEQMSKLLRGMRQTFDFVVIDLPPMGAVVDSRAIGPLLDSTVLVTEWGRTPRSTVAHALESNRVLRDKCLGVILNKVDLGRIGLYAEVQNDYYYNSRYGSYYQEG